ncbi:unnamed protein product [Psylliodes chrysocephalus]|uniref:Lipoprotein n=1 Tax=Psylliodes chrysocephalus TaxID=3402493 RepID=A0A9P0CDI3_9CUCU|nr:unnamed protein product [Psylliodes chrysocephala]
MKVKYTNLVQPFAILALVSCISYIHVSFIYKPTGIRNVATLLKQF